MSLDINYCWPIFKSTILENYINFDRRVSRYDFWHYVLIAIVISLAVTLVMSMLGALGDIIDFIFSLALILPGLGLAVRRLHDTGKGWPWILLMFIPVIGWLALIWFYAQPGDPGDNEFGPVPPVRSA